GAADGGGDVGIAELQAVAPMRGRRLRRKSGFVEHPIKKMSGAVAGEGTAGTVGTVGPRREPQNQQACLRVAPSRNRLSPVVPIEVGTALFLADLATVRDQPRTARASNDFLIQLGEAPGDDRKKLAGGSHPLSLTQFVKSQPPHAVALAARL